MIPAIGGGLCQLSNALYQVALDSGCEILERHPHSRIVPGSATSAGRDATVAWNYIDLRFRARQTIQLRVLLTSSELKVSVRTANPTNHSIPQHTPRSEAVEVPPIFSDHACESCGNATCFRHQPSSFNLRTRSVSAFLLDAAWPEFKTYVAQHHNPADVLAIPMDGNRWNRTQYDWPTQNFAKIHTSTLATMLRAARNRHIPAQGASRQKVLLERASAIAHRFAKSLTSDIDEVCVSQSLLPFLWQTGVLGGRRIRVLMSQLPARTMQVTLDRALRQLPDSKTLGDFRAEPALIDAEDEALHDAEHFITPHAHIASLFPAKVTLLDWTMPPPTQINQTPTNGQPTILFPASTLGRKGAYALREAVSGLDVTLLLGGPVLENEKFWDNFKTRRVTKSLEITPDLVVLPTLIESQPRLLLEALASNIPVITTKESGLHPDCGAHWVKSLDAQSLRAAIAAQIMAIFSHF